MFCVYGEKKRTSQRRFDEKKENNGGKTGFGVGCQRKPFFFFIFFWMALYFIKFKQKN